MNIRIYNEIKRRILFLRYKPGVYLNELRIAKELGVSRTPVRESLLRLQWEHLVDIIPRGGIIVKKVDFQELRDVFQTRILLEGEITKHACSNVTRKGIEELEEIIGQCNKMRGDAKTEKLIYMDIEFRSVMHKLSKRPILCELSDFLYNQTLRVWYLVFEMSGFDVELEKQIAEMKASVEFLFKQLPRIGK